MTITVCPINPPGHDWQAGLTCRWCQATRTPGEAVLSGLASARGWSRDSARTARDAYRAGVVLEALAAVESERLRDDTSHPEDKAYGQAIDDAVTALSRLADADFEDAPLMVSRFDTAMEPASDDEHLLLVGAIDEHGRPVALCFDTENRRKVGGWLAPDKAEDAPLDFFQPGHTYLYERLRWRFRCDAVTSRPDTGKRVAVGYSFFGHGNWQTGDMSEGIWAEGGWSDVTEAGDRDV